MLPRPLPTPLLAFAIRELGCAAGVMVTASHNPPQDNGYKVYLGDGSQIVPPADTEIAARIEAVGAMADIPRGNAGTVLDEEIIDRYLDTVAGLAGDGPRDLTIVYTPLHGVGGTSVIQVLETAGFSAPHVVSQQEEPDPEFPTVAFPNPEEPGAMDLAMALAADKGADLVVANDPDADRCAVAVPGPHGWRMLRGDEVGALLGHHLLALGRTGTYANSIVSSSLLGKMAAAGGPAARGDADRVQVDQPRARARVRLRGGARLLRRPRPREGQGRRLRAPADLRDGRRRPRPRAAASTTCSTTSPPSTACTRPTSCRSAFDDLAEIPATMQRLRDTPPTSLGGLAVERIDDLSLGSDALPPTDGLRFALADGARVIVRPSGTEPKVKCYLEVVIPVDPEDGVDAARISAAGRLDAIKGDIKAAAGL